MLESLISESGIQSFTFTNVLSILGSAIILGLIISLVYINIHKKEGYSRSFVITLVMLPIIISTIILLVGNNVARAFSLAGAFSIIRFRSVPGNSKDITYVFFTLAVGLACGMGFIGYALLFTIILCLLVLLLEKVNFGVMKSNMMKLKITIPEDLNYDGIFDEVLRKYADSYKLVKVKTRDFGALFELDYAVTLKDDTVQKKFIDELRCKNGNLNIALTLLGYDKEIL